MTCLHPRPAAVAVRHPSPLGVTSATPRRRAGRRLLAETVIQCVGETLDRRPAVEHGRG
ncbi:Hypothetical protein CAP_0995 [Chondromyces apiculatus DSM 436]|uniref:Uncharacterized protein n=1 Tax=Chondromyces apiculatus DSM 436 TaxID=1192034 RepID=A0A017SVD3_9BACT|nr:Hypothetical protein CAP_0995 [Chondromyces apiculatus DSM 436]